VKRIGFPPKEQLGFDFSPVVPEETFQQPGSPAQVQDLIRGATIEAFRKALTFYELGRVNPPEIDFSLKGRSAGQAAWRVDKGPGSVITKLKLRFNLEAYALDPEDMIRDTIPHEVAHLVVALRHGRRAKPHGPEWESVMRGCFGIAPKRTHRLQLTPARKVARSYIYSCDCQEHPFTSIRHNRILKERKKYRCVACKGSLVYKEQR